MGWGGDFSKVPWQLCSEQDVTGARSLGPWTGVHFRRHHSPLPVVAGGLTGVGRQDRRHPPPARAESVDPSAGDDENAIWVSSSRRGVYTTPITTRTSLESL